MPLLPLHLPEQTKPSLLHLALPRFPFKVKFLETEASHPHLPIHTSVNLVSTSAPHLPKVTNALLKANGVSGWNPQLSDLPVVSDVDTWGAALCW